MLYQNVTNFERNSQKRLFYIRPICAMQIPSVHDDQQISVIKSLSPSVCFFIRFQFNSLADMWVRCDSRGEKTVEQNQTESKRTCKMLNFLKISNKNVLLEHR